MSETTFNYIVKPRPFGRSPVDIIIPFHGQYQKTMACFRSVLETTRGNPYTITLVDDGSPNADFLESLRTVRNVQGVRHDTRQGFGAALRSGFDATKNPWVVFLNSDCEVRDTGWLVEMGDALLELKAQNVRMVAARSNSPGSGVHPALTAKSNEPGEHVVLGDSHLPLYCALCHRDLFANIGGFVKPYPMGYEDEELAYRMRRCGFKQAVCGTSWVFHHGGATLDDMYFKSPKWYEAQCEVSRDMCLKDIRK